ncbi:MAG: glucose-6-phosphate isomerase [Gaiellaceae bacterium]|jgi:glucose-6-phosphate isomerase
MSSVGGNEMVARIWARDASLWTSSGEQEWLGWLNAPAHSRAQVGEILSVAERALEGVENVVLLGMGGSSLAPEVMRRAFGAASFHVLDSTHPAAVRRLSSELDPSTTLFVVSSKSGSTIETRSHLDYFWNWASERGERFAAVTDPGSALETLARDRGFIEVFAGEPTIGGRYSALSPFGVVPAALMGIDVERLLSRAEEMVEACRGEAGNPGLELGLELGEGWRYGHDKVCIPKHESGFALWAEQLIAESTGKQGKGLVPAPGEHPGDTDRQAVELRLESAYELGQEFFRWEFAVAVAGALMEINPFDQPNVQEAKDRTNTILASGGEPDLEPRGELEQILTSAAPGDYIAILGFVDPTSENDAKLAALAERVRTATGCIVTRGFGPRYLHSTGQLHKGGKANGLFLQVIDDFGEELAIPGRDFGFRRLIAAQAAGDFAALEEHERPVVRVRLEEL